MRLTNSVSFLLLWALCEMPSGPTPSHMGVSFLSWGGGEGRGGEGRGIRAEGGVAVNIAPGRRSDRPTNQPTLPR